MSRDDPVWHLELEGLETVLSGPVMAAQMTQHAETGQVWATTEANARAHDTGEYADSFEVRTRIEKVNGINRQVSMIVNTDYKAWAVEWANGAHFILQRTGDVIRTGKG